MAGWVQIAISIGQALVIGLLGVTQTLARRRRRREARDEQTRDERLARIEADIQRLWELKEGQDTCQLKHDHLREEVERLMRASGLNGQGGSHGRKR